MTEPIWRVVLLEDDKNTRTYFEQCIAAHPQLTLSASFEALGAARSWFANNSADVLLTDLALPDGHGLTLIKELAQRQSGCDILVVSVFGDEDTVLACVESGAVGYIHKDSRPADVAQVIVDVKGGASPISPMIARKLLQRLRAQVPTPVEMPAHASQLLSPRESEVLELIARGYAYSEIARLQGVTMHTVQSHIKNLYSKLAVHSRSEAVFEASRMGLLNSMRATD
ncbi:MAG TPA: response regulator transcription factor [Steroidobacteraceae bacterium]|nr:response regulator transcription factor [Steroidobacteraceae bacterium]